MNPASRHQPAKSALEHDGMLRLRLLYHLPRRQRREFLSQLAEMGAMREIREQSDDDAKAL